MSHSKLLGAATAATICIAAAANAGGAGGPVFAAPVIAPAPIAPAALSWGGAFAGVRLGAAAFDSEIHDYDEEAAYGYSSKDGIGALAGIELGYNVQNGNFVYGAVGTLAATSFSESFVTDFCGDTTHSTEVNALATLRGRAGIATGNTHFYATAGAGLISGDTELDCDGDPVSNDSHIALVGGVGVEHRISGNLSVNFEYLHYEGFDEESTFEDDDDEFARFDMDGSTVTLGLTYHFN